MEQFYIALTAMAIVRCKIYNTAECSLLTQLQVTGSCQEPEVSIASGRSCNPPCRHSFLWFFLVSKQMLIWF
jgi:hypothetical protein